MAARILIAAWWLPIMLPIWMLKFGWKFRGFRKLVWLIVSMLLLCCGVVMFARDPNRMLGLMTSQAGLVAMTVFIFLLGRGKQGKRHGTVVAQQSWPVVQQGWQQARPHVYRGFNQGAVLVQAAGHAVMEPVRLKLRHRAVLGYMAVGERMEEGGTMLKQWLQRRRAANRTVETGIPQEESRPEETVVALQKYADQQAKELDPRSSQMGHGWRGVGG